MTSLISLDHELRAVKGKLDEKVYQCKREQLEQNFSEFSEDELVMENAIKDAASTFEVVRNETKSIRTLKEKLGLVKEELGKEVAKSHGQLKEALHKLKISKSCSASVHKYNAIMLEKKMEGSEMQLEMGLKKLRKIEVFQKELDTATADLLSVLSTYQQRCVDRILKSPTPLNQNLEPRLPTKQSTQVDVIVAAIRCLREENEKLKADLESMATSNSSGNGNSLTVQELENVVCQLKLQVFELQNEAREREETIAKRILEESSEHDGADSETGQEDDATGSEHGSEFTTIDPPGKGAAERTIDGAKEELDQANEEPAVDKEVDECDIDSVDKDVKDLRRIIDQAGEQVDDQKISPADREVDDIAPTIKKSADEDADDGSIDAADEEDSYGFEDMSPSPVPMPKPIVELEDQITELEIHDMGDIKLVQPDYEQLVLDQMRHEEELEEYAVKILGLKETISELEEENRELKGQIAFAEGEDANADEIQQLESEVSMWRLKYEESAAGSAQIHRLRVELERSKAKSKKRVAVLQEDLQTLQKNGSDRIKNLIQKFKSFQEEGAARVQTLEAELEKSRAEVHRLQNTNDDETEAETDTSEQFLDDQSENHDEVDEIAVVETSSQSPECAGENASDGVDESENVRSECDGYKTASDSEETRILREKLEAMKIAKREAEKRANEEIKHLQDTIASMKKERDMKQEIISSLHEQLEETETALTQKTKSMNFPTLYSYGSPLDSDTD